jgi:polyisoprenoid-binding protein YceI
MKRGVVGVALAALAVVAAALALAADGGIDAGRSTITATFKQESVPVEAPFRKFSGHIVYVANNPAGATASIDVETGSLDIGDPAYNAEVRKAAWFDSAAFPFASFRSTAVKAISATRFEATIPITLVAAGGSTAFEGTLPVSRKAFAIGDPIWNDVIDDTVSVRFHLVNSAH